MKFFLIARKLSIVPFGAGTKSDASPTLANDSWVDVQTIDNHLRRDLGLETRHGGATPHLPTVF